MMEYSRGENVIQMLLSEAGVEHIYTWK